MKCGDYDKSGINKNVETTFYISFRKHKTNHKTSTLTLKLGIYKKLHRGLAQKGCTMQTLKQSVVPASKRVTYCPLPDSTDTKIVEGPPAQDSQ